MITKKYISIENYKKLMKNLNVFIVSVILLAIMIPMASASIGNLGTFKQGECINLLQTCADCSYNNLSSVTQPDGIKGFGVLTTMTKSGTEYTFEFCNTTKSGTYNVNGYGDPGGVLTKWNYILEVTPTGSENNTTFFIILIIIAVGLVLLGFILHNYVFAFFGGVSFLIVGIYSMIYGYGGVTNTYSRMISLVIIGLGSLITMLSALDLLGSFDKNGDDF